MKKVIHFKFSIVSILLFIVIGTQISYTQNVININKCDSKDSNRIAVLEAINSQDITMLKNSMNSSHNSNFIAEIELSNISILNRISNSNTNNIRFLIIKIDDDIVSLNLAPLNQFNSLEIIHFIVEKQIDENTLEDIFNNSNNNWVITYQIEIPQ